MPQQAKQNSFSSGEIAEEYFGHDDYRINQTGLALCRNMVVRHGGGLTRRPPTERIAKAYDISIFIEMVVRSDDEFMIEMGHQVARFYRNGAPLLNGAVIYEIAHPYLGSELEALRWQRSGDVLYITHPTRGMWQLTRIGNVNWLSALLILNEMAFLDENINETKLIQSTNITGNVTLTATGFTFTAAQVGTQIKFRDGNQQVIKGWETNETNINAISGGLRTYNGNVYQNIGAVPGVGGPNPPIHESGVRWTGGDVKWKFIRASYGIATITSVAVGGATAQATVNVQLPEEFCALYNANYGGTAQSFRFSEQAFSSALGWPDNIELHQQRIFLFKGPKFYYSVVADYLNFATGSTPRFGGSELLGATNGSAESVQWAISGKVLLIGVGGLEYSVSGAQTSGGISAQNLKIEVATSDGSSAAQALRAGNAILHVNGDGTRLYEVIFNFQIDAFDSQDRALPSLHLMQYGLKKIVFQRDPLGIVWAIDYAGQLLALTYNPKQEIFAWQLHPMPNAFVEDIAIGRNVALKADDLWLRVRRTVAGRTEIGIERLLDFFSRKKNLNMTEMPYLDNQSVAVGVNFKVISGLTHYAGSRVRVVSNLGDEGFFDVDATGQLTLINDGINRAVIGQQILSRVKFLPLNMDLSDGASEGRARVIKEVVVRCVGGPDAYAGSFDGDHDLAEAIFTKSVTADDGFAIMKPEDAILQTGDWDAEGMLDLWTDGPYPFDIVRVDRVVDFGGK